METPTRTADARAATSASATHVSVVLPTLNEAASIREAVERVKAALEQASCPSFEIIVADDSSDDATPCIADELSAADPERVRVLHRTGARSLGGSVADAWEIARGDVLVLIDADLQHPPEIVPRLVAAIDGGADVVVGSRYVHGGQVGFGLGRKILSSAVTAAVRNLGGKAGLVLDPLSGCFAVRRSVVAGRNIRAAGFKVLMEVLRAGEFRQVREIPLDFGARKSGESNMRWTMMREDLLLLWRMVADPAAGEVGHIPPLARMLAYAGVLCLLAITAMRVWTVWPRDAYMDHVSGIWLARAYDLLHGEFYRAVSDSRGFGGTRYFPLASTVLAILWRLFDWRIAAYTLAAGSMALLMAAVYFVVTRSGARRYVGVICAIAVLGGVSTQEALFMIRPDAVAAALNLFGLGICLRNPLRRRDAALAGLCFALAFSAKFTAPYAVVCVLVALLLARRAKPAIMVALFSAIGGAAVISLLLVFGGHNFVENMRLASTVGSSFASLATGPHRLYEMLLRCPGERLALFVAILCVLAAPRKLLLSLPGIYWLGTLVVTAVILSAPGTNRNHFVDMVAACVVLPGVWIAHNPRRAAAGLTAIALLITVQAAAAYDANRSDDWTDYHALRARLVPKLPTNGPILAENPLYALQAGQRPYLLDPFMFYMISQKHPEWTARLHHDLETHRFAAVVLEHPPHGEFGRAWYSGTHFGPGFISTLEANYEVTDKRGGISVYTPK